jgi:hypothetical protein
MTTDPVIAAAPEIIGNVPLGGRTLGLAMGPVKGDTMQYK